LRVFLSKFIIKIHNLATLPADPYVANALRSSRSGAFPRGTLRPIPGFWNRGEYELGYDIRTIQQLLGHKDVSTTMISTTF